MPTTTFDPQGMGLTPEYSGGTFYSSPEQGITDPGTQFGWAKALSGDQTQHYGMQGEDWGISQNRTTWDTLKPIAALAAIALTAGAASGAFGAAGAGAGTAAGATGAASAADIAALANLGYSPTGLAALAEGAGASAADIAALADLGASTAGTSLSPLAATGVGSYGTIAPVVAGAPAAAASTVPGWLNSIAGPGTFLGGSQGMFTGTGGLVGALNGTTGWGGPLLSAGSGLYGLHLANQMRATARDAIANSTPWTTSGGTAMAGEALKRLIAGDFTQDPGFNAAQLAAARTSAQQPGGFAASAAAQAALKYQNDRIAALSGPAGVGFSPAAGYQLGLSGQTAANQLASSSLGSIGFELTGAGQSMPPWLQQYLIQNGLRGG